MERAAFLALLRAREAEMRAMIEAILAHLPECRCATHRKRPATALLPGLS